jgi:hypothetical protein
MKLDSDGSGGLVTASAPPNIKQVIAVQHATVPDCFIA